MPSMVHPYTGELVMCAQDNGEQHVPCGVVTDVRQWDFCELCTVPIEVCRYCRYVISCCDCGRYHSFDCPWPL